MKGFILGIIVTLAAIALGVYIYFGQGFAPVATSAQPMPFEKRLANMALHARQEKEAPKNVPIQVNDENLLAGAQTYLEHCAVCHGTPNQQQTAIAKGEFPKPPHLFQQHGDHVGVSDDPAGETFWKVENGIRMTGMPAFKDSLSANQMWQVSILLANADKLPDTVKATLVQNPPVPPSEQAPGPTHPETQKK